MTLLLTLAVATLLPADSATSLRKCANPTFPGAVLVVDDVVVHDYRGTGTSLDATGLVPEDALWVEVRCLLVRSDETASGWARRGAAIVLTEQGAPKLMERHLTELVAEQRAYRARTGSYATSLADLKFLDSRTNVGIKLVVDGDGWSATAAFKGVDVTCRVADEIDAAQPGVPLCLPSAPPGQPPQQPTSSR